MSDLPWGSDLIASPHPRILFGFFLVLLVEQPVKAFVVFTGVLGLKGAKTQICVYVGLLGGGCFIGSGGGSGHWGVALPGFGSLSASTIEA